MTTWDRYIARAALDSLALDRANAEVAAHWLSLWTVNGPPTHDGFSPRQVIKHLPAIAIFEIQLDGTSTCRLAGAFLQAVFGRNLFALESQAQRDARVRSYRMVVIGAIAYGVRRFSKQDGTQTTAAEIALPFADVGQDGGRRLLFHSAWRPEALGGLGQVIVPVKAGRLRDQQILSICA